jgi:hypothetical protein
MVVHSRREERKHANRNRDARHGVRVNPPPAVESIKDSATAIAGSVWMVKDLLRQGKLKAVKAGRRTLVVVASRDAYLKSLPPATYLPPRRKRA